MNQVHVIIGKRRSSHGSMQAAFSHVRSIVIYRRIDNAVEEFVMEFLRTLFLIK